jgi:hypothetical protein
MGFVGPAERGIVLRHEHLREHRDGRAEHLLAGQRRAERLLQQEADLALRAGDADVERQGVGVARSALRTEQFGPHLRTVAVREDDAPSLRHDTGDPRATSATCARSEAIVGASPARSRALPPIAMSALRCMTPSSRGGRGPASGLARQPISAQSSAFSVWRRLAAWRNTTDCGRVDDVGRHLLPAVRREAVHEHGGGRARRSSAGVTVKPANASRRSVPPRLPGPC